MVAATRFVYIIKPDIAKEFFLFILGIKNEKYERQFLTGSFILSIVMMNG